MHRSSNALTRTVQPLNQPAARRRRDPRAFTLIELLVVIAIIAVLVSILLPMLNSAKESARIAVCATQMRAMHWAIRMYANEFNGYIPAMTCGGSGGWKSDNALEPESNQTATGITQIQAWHRGKPKHYPREKADWSLCPSDRDPKHTQENTDPTEISYTIYGWLWQYAGDRRADIFTAVRLDKLRDDDGVLRESEVLLLAETVRDNTSGVGSFRGAQHATASKYGTYVDFRYLFRHQRDIGMNTVYLDGHGKFVTWENWNNPSTDTRYWY